MPKITEIVYEEEVTLEVKAQNNLLPALYPNAKAVDTYKGTVRPRADYDPPDSVRIIGDREMPVRVVCMSNIITWNGKKFSFKSSVAAPVPKAQPRFVIVKSGSSNKEYKVTFNEDGTKTCTCTGFGYRRTCKHITEAV